MRRALLIYNPNSGIRRGSRLAEVEEALQTLRAGGVDADMVATQSSAEALAQTKLAVQAGYDTVFACGGDGTVHDVLQGVVNTPVALGVLPLGTANALACDLRIPEDPVGAARMALRGRVRRIGVGKVQFIDFLGHTSSRYFTVTAGVGVDAHLFYRLNTGLKKSFGMFSYYLKATHLWLTDPLHLFSVEYSGNREGEPSQAHVSELLAVRISNFGKVLQQLAPGASLDNPQLRLVLFHTRSRWRYLLYIIRGLLRQGFRVPGIELADAATVECRGAPPPRQSEAAANLRIFVEADGELVGTLPAELTIMPDALSLLAP
jgi:YegS/Rv2252/BmrU family lipid kinase